MERQHINVKYLKSLSEVESALIKQFNGYWRNQDEALSLEIHFDHAQSSHSAEQYSIITMSTSNQEIALAHPTDTQFVICLQLKDSHHLYYQVMQSEKIGISKPFLLEKGRPPIF